MANKTVQQPAADAVRQLIVHEDAKSPIAEAYRTLRTNIQFSKGDSELSVILFTSAGPGEGKSTTCANTAVAMAQSGKKVVLVDCDLRKPVQHRIFQAQKRGVTNILVENAVVDETIQATAVENLQMIACGPIPPNPSELLGTHKMADLIAKLRGLYDYVLIDAPPVIAVTDASVLASKVDGVVLVMDAGTVKPEMAKKAKQLIINAKGHILGVILNRVEIEADQEYYYYYYGHEKK